VEETGELMMHLGQHVAPGLQGRLHAGVGLQRLLALQQAEALLQVGAPQLHGHVDRERQIVAPALEPLGVVPGNQHSRDGEVIVDLPYA
jgi:hypothetical protein